MFEVETDSANSAGTNRSTRGARDTSG